MRRYPGGIRHDYKEIVLTEPRGRWRHASLFALGVALPIVAVSILLVGEDSKSNVPPPVAASPPSPVAALSVTPDALERELENPLDVPANDDDALAAPPPIAPQVLAREAKSELLELVVARGDTLDTLFRRNGLRLADLAAMTKLPDAAAHLRLLRPGDTLTITHRGGEVLGLDREINDIDLLSIVRDGTAFRSETIARPVERRIVGAQGRIRSSLFEAGTSAGITDAIIMDMAGIFQWDIDFIQDVRVDDSFTVLYEELWRSGTKLGNGNIIAAEFVNRGHSYRAARYTDPTGHSDYYSPEGRSVRKAFVRAPVDFTRISGNFNPNRRHPILNTIRAHRGVDYAAPTGTPVRAAGDGKIVERGPNGGFGNAVVIQHGGNITTLYAHLSRFANIKIGSRVKQGDTIGYVGQTGLATGPHLHYEYRVNGVHRNPRTVTLPPAEPVARQYLADFESTAGALWSQLDSYRGAWVAANAE